MWYLLAFGLGQVTMLAICLVAVSWHDRDTPEHAYKPQDM